MPQSFTARVQKFIEDVVNPSLSAHGGWVEVVTADEETGVVNMKMGGGCHGCAASAMTMQHGIQSVLKDEFPQINKIIDLTDHTSGENPFFLGVPDGESEGS